MKNLTAGIFAGILGLILAGNIPANAATSSVPGTDLPDRTPTAVVGERVRIASQKYVDRVASAKQDVLTAGDNIDIITLTDPIDGDVVTTISSADVKTLVDTNNNVIVGRDKGDGGIVKYDDTDGKNEYTVSVPEIVTENDPGVLTVEYDQSANAYSVNLNTDALGKVYTGGEYITLSGTGDTVINGAESTEYTPDDPDGQIMTLGRDLEDGGFVDYDSESNKFTFSLPEIGFTDDGAGLLSYEYLHEKNEYVIGFDGYAAGNYLTLTGNTFAGANVRHLDDGNGVPSLGRRKADGGIVKYDNTNNINEFTISVPSVRGLARDVTYAEGGKIISAQYNVTDNYYEISGPKWGSLSDGSGGLVTGGIIFDALQQKQDILTPGERVRITSTTDSQTGEVVTTIESANVRHLLNSAGTAHVFGRDSDRDNSSTGVISRDGIVQYDETNNEFTLSLPDIVGYAPIDAAYAEDKNRWDLSLNYDSDVFIVSEGGQLTLADGVIPAPYRAGTNVDFTTNQAGETVINATDTTYEAGDYMTLVDGAFNGAESTEYTADDPDGLRMTLGRDLEDGGFVDYDSESNKFTFSLPEIQFAGDGAGLLSYEYLHEKNEYVIGFDGYVAGDYLSLTGNTFAGANVRHLLDSDQMPEFGRYLDLGMGNGGDELGPFRPDIINYDETANEFTFSLPDVKPDVLSPITTKYTQENVWRLGLNYNDDIFTVSDGQFTLRDGVIPEDTNTVYTAGNYVTLSGTDNTVINSANVTELADNERNFIFGRDYNAADHTGGIVDYDRGANEFTVSLPELRFDGDGADLLSGRYEQVKNDYIISFDGYAAGNYLTLTGNTFAGANVTEYAAQGELFLWGRSWEDGGVVDYDESTNTFTISIPGISRADRSPVVGWYDMALNQYFLHLEYTNGLFVADDTSLGVRKDKTLKFVDTDGNGFVSGDGALSVNIDGETIVSDPTTGVLSVNTDALGDLGTTYAQGDYVRFTGTENNVINGANVTELKEEERVILGRDMHDDEGGIVEYEDETNTFTISPPDIVTANAADLLEDYDVYEGARTSAGRPKDEGGLVVYANNENEFTMSVPTVHADGIIEYQGYSEEKNAYQFSSPSIGSVASGNYGLVTGGAVYDALAKKQDKLTAGDNVKITTATVNGNTTTTISATGVAPVGAGPITVSYNATTDKNEIGLWYGRGLKKDATDAGLEVAINNSLKFVAPQVGNTNMGNGTLAVNIDGTTITQNTSGALQVNVSAGTIASSASAPSAAGPVSGETVFNYVGDTAALSTDTKTTLVAAVNDLDSNVENVSAEVATVSEAVGDVKSLNTSDNTTVVAAVNELDANIGDMNALSQDMGVEDLVAAILKNYELVPKMPEDCDGCVLQYTEAKGYVWEKVASEYVAPASNE